MYISIKERKQFEGYYKHDGTLYHPFESNKADRPRSLATRLELISDMRPFQTSPLNAVLGSSDLISVSPIRNP